MEVKDTEKYKPSVNYNFLLHASCKEHINISDERRSTLMYNPPPPPKLTKQH
jgi:hypothetical protein